MTTTMKPVPARSARTSVSPAAAEIKLIHIAKTALGMDDDTYRAMLQAQTGKTSSKLLTAAERRKVLAHLKRAGFDRRPQHTTGPDTAALMTKLRALWWSLADAGAVTRPASHQACDDAIEAWALRSLSTACPPVQRLRFAGLDQMQALVEQLKAWVRRVGARSRHAA